MIQNKTPEGCLTDPQGRHVPLNLIRPVDMKRHTLVGELVNAAKIQNQLLGDFKVTCFERMEEFMAYSAKQSKTKAPRGAKGNYTLLSFDGRYKVTVQRQTKIAFNENLQNAKTLIDECLKARMDGGDPLINTLVQDAFQVDQEGQVNIGKILSLRRHAVEDPKWKRAMEAIGQSMQVVGSKDYLRFYERLDSGEYAPISLDLAVV